MDDLTWVTQFINTIGFPIFVAVWMLFKDAKEKDQTRKTLCSLAEAVRDLKEVIVKNG